MHLHTHKHVKMTTTTKKSTRHLIFKRNFHKKKKIRQRMTDNRQERGVELTTERIPWPSSS